MNLNPLMACEINWWSQYYASINDYIYVVDNLDLNDKTESDALLEDQNTDALNATNQGIHAFDLISCLLKSFF